MHDHRENIYITQMSYTRIALISYVYVRTLEWINKKLRKI